MADLNALMIFAKVVEANSFSGAARRLDLPVSTVSRRIAELEDQLGVRLPKRSTRSLSLTEIGSQVLERGGGIEGGRVVLAGRAAGLWRRWVAEHHDYQPSRPFVDDQREGPFAYWEHRHRVRRATARAVDRATTGRSLRVLRRRGQPGTDYPAVAAIPHPLGDVRDLVCYALPLGPFGMVAHRLIVRRDLGAMFNYRTRKVREYFEGRP